MKSQGFPTKTVTEGCVKLLIPDIPVKGSAEFRVAPRKTPVFYNPSLTLSRDLAVLVLRAYFKALARRVSGCDALAGCGVRGLRLVAEVDGVDSVVVNDINPIAAEMASTNVEINGLGAKVSVENEDARLLFLKNSASGMRFDYIDIDPFGSPAPFIQSAALAIRDGGILAATATDTAVLCGLYPKACFRKYWAQSLKTEYHHEVAARLLLGFIARSLAMHGMGVEPLLTYREAHYIRVYVLVRSGAKSVNESVRGIGYLHHCFRCLNRGMKHGFTSEAERTCGGCGHVMASAGPLWVEKLLEKAFCERLYDEAQASTFKEKKPLLRLLVTLINEAEAAATYYIPAKVCKKLGIQVPPTRIITDRIKHMGYSFNKTHYAVDGFKTDAPARVVVEAVKLG